MLHKIILIVTFTFFSVAMNAQELIATSGGSSSNTNVQISWSIGELMIETFVHPSLILTQGFQQSGYTISSVYDANEIAFDIMAFPNPVKDRLNISWGEYKEEVELRVFDAAGNVKKLIEMPSIILSTEVDMSDMGVGTYLFCVFNKEGKLLKTIQIIKH